MITYIRHWGSDRAIAEAAWVSMSTDEIDRPLADVERVLKYMAKHNHWSPFAHVGLAVKITAPIFIARQLAKHQVGFAWNEESRRYVDYVPEAYKINTFRARPDNIKQGSEGTVEDQRSCGLIYDEAIDFALHVYKNLLNLGVAPEQARAVLPLASMTTWIWSGSLQAWSRVYHLRTDPHAQEETKNILQGIWPLCSKYFPIAWKELTS